MPKANGEAGQFKSKTGGTKSAPPVDRAPKLADIGVTKKESARAQKLAAIPPKVIEKRVRRIEGAEESDRWIAEQCAVSHQLVGEVRHQLVAATTSTSKPANAGQGRKGKDGKQRLLEALREDVANGYTLVSRENGNPRAGQRRVAWSMTIQSIAIDLSVSVILETALAGPRNETRCTM